MAAAAGASHHSGIKSVLKHLAKLQGFQWRVAKEN